MKEIFEEKILFNVLMQIHKNEYPSKAPDDEYINSLEKIRLINKGWDITLTDFGESFYEYLKNKYIKY